MKESLEIVVLILVLLTVLCARVSSMMSNGKPRFRQDSFVRAVHIGGIPMPTRVSGKSINHFA